jgi:hypothetical protein
VVISSEINIIDALNYVLEPVMNSPFMGAVEKVAGGRRRCVQPLNNLAKKTCRGTELLG